MKLNLDEKKIVEMYKNGDSCAKIGKEFGVCHQVISKRLKENGIEVIVQPRKKKNIDSDYKLIINSFLNGESIASISKRYNCSTSVIKRILKENNINTSNRKDGRINNCNQDFFNIIDSEEKAYWLGFLYADGCISNDTASKKYSVDIALQISDIEHLEKFKRSLSATNSVRTRTSNIKEKEYKSCRFSFHSKKMANDLCVLGCVPKKSMILKFPTIEQVPNHLIRHFIRGYFDGDGSVYWHKRNYICANILGTDDFLNGCNLIFKENIPTYTINKLYKKQKSECKFILKGRTQALAILDFLYNDATIYLERKFNKYIELKQRYNCLLNSKLQKS